MIRRKKFYSVRGGSISEPIIYNYFKYFVNWWYYRNWFAIWKQIFIVSFLQYIGGDFSYFKVFQEIVLGRLALLIFYAGQLLRVKLGIEFVEVFVFKLFYCYVHCLGSNSQVNKGNFWDVSKVVWRVRYRICCSFTNWKKYSFNLSILKKSYVSHELYVKFMFRN